MNKKYIGLVSVLVICIGVLGYNTYAKKENLMNHGTQTTAVIEKISTNRIDHEYSPTVENIHVTYKYVVGAKDFIKTQEISRNEHNLYFAKTGKKGDSVGITYDKNNPINSMIEKIK